MNFFLRLCGWSDRHYKWFAFKTFDLLVLNHPYCSRLSNRIQCLLKSDSLFHCQFCNLIRIDGCWLSVGWRGGRFCLHGWIFCMVPWLDPAVQKLKHGKKNLIQFLLSDQRNPSATQSSTGITFCQVYIRAGWVECGFINSTQASGSVSTVLRAIH